MEVITLLQGDRDSHLTPLFLVHAISGTALPYLRLLPLSDEDRPVYGITNPLHCANAESFKYPSSLAGLAALYLDGVARIQPHGPYLLGGWSMGGMIAMFMAQILQARGEPVAKVIMIDSANPEILPAFASAQEHRELARATYDKTIALVAREMGADGSPPVSPIASPVIGNDEGFDDYWLRRQRRASTWRTWSCDSSSSSSIFFDSPASTAPGSPALSSMSTSDYSSDCDDDDNDKINNKCISQSPNPYEYDDDEEEEDEDEDEDEEEKEEEEEEDDDDDDDDDETDMDSPALKGFLGQIKLHIHKGLQLIADVRPGDLFTPHKRSNYDVVLIKCRPDHQLHHHNMHLPLPAHQKVDFVMSVMRENSMRWNAGQFRSFETKAFSGDHNGAFAPEHVGELSMILRECLEDED